MLPVQLKFLPLHIFIISSLLSPDIYIIVIQETKWFFIKMRSIVHVQKTLGQKLNNITAFSKYFLNKTQNYSKRLQNYYNSSNKMLCFYLSPFFPIIEIITQYKSKTKFIH